MMTLNFVPRARNEESPRSLLVRAAHMNGFKSVAKMIAALHGENNRRPLEWQLNDSSMAKLFEALDERAHLVLPFHRRSSRVTRGAPILINNIAIPLNHLRTTEHAICPGCLADGWQRYIQDVNFIDECPYHQCRYIMTCPACEQNLTWTDCNGTLCQCSFDLRNCPKQPSSSSFSKHLLSIFQNQDQAKFGVFLDNLKALRYSSVIHSSEKKEVLELALAIALHDKRSIEIGVSKSIAHYAVAPTLFFVAPWLLSKDEEIKTTAIGLLSHDVSALALDQNNQSSQPLWLLRDELETIGINQPKLHTLKKMGLITQVKIKTNTPHRYYSTEWASVQNWLNSSGSPKLAITSPSHLDIEQAALYLDVYPEVVRSAVRAHFMASNTKTGKSGKLLLCKEEVSTFHQKYIFVGPLAKSLGSPNTTLTARLMSVGIKPISGPTIDGSLVAIYQRSTLDMSKIAQALAAETYSHKAGRKLHALQPSDNHISSTDTAKILGMEVQRLKYLERVGLLREETPSQFLSENRRYFTKNSVFSTQTILNNSITIEDASNKLGVSIGPLTRRFIKSGFIKPLLLGRRTLITCDDVEIMRENLTHYCSCDQLDKYLRAPTGHTANLISTGRIFVASPEESGIRTVRLISWKQVKNLATHQ